MKLREILEEFFFYIFLAGVVVVFFGLMGYAVIQSGIHLAETETKLQTDGFQILQSDIQTPSVIIIVDTYDEFVQICRDLEVEQVYQEGFYFYVFTDDWELGYKYYGG